MDTWKQLKLSFETPAREVAVKPQGTVGKPSASAASERQKWNGTQDMELMEQVVAGGNVLRALERLEEKKGKAPGIDGMRVQELRPYLRANWPELREQLLEGEYEPQPVRRTEIPKDGGRGMRKLGIPTVLDRFIQHALLQVLNPIFDPTFSHNSFGFRPGRSQRQAIQRAQTYVQDGKRWVVDMDLSKFFDRVNHDMVMARVARKVGDKRVLKLIRRYLEAGVMVDGVVVDTEEGTPQGGPLSPLLSNIMLDDLDKELERREHSFVRYADDFQVYVNSRRAGERVMASLQKYVESTLRLRVNQDKSAVDRAWKRTYLGFGFYRRPDGQVRLRLAPKTLRRLKEKLRELTSRRWSVAMSVRIKRLNEYIRGWLGYYRIADAKGHLERIAQWLRRRLRMCVWKQWKRCRTKLRKLRGLGIAENEARKMAFSRKSYWALSTTPQLNQALDNQFWLNQGLIDLLPTYLASR